MAEMQTLSLCSGVPAPPPLGAVVGHAGLDGHPSDRSLVRVAVGHQLLQLQGAPADEAERRAHGAGAIHVALPQGPQRVGVVEGHAALFEVEAHAEPRRQRVRDAFGRGGAVAVGISVGVSMVTVGVVAVLRQVNFAHPHGEEAERRRRVQRILRPAVMAAVGVIPAAKKHLNAQMIPALQVRGHRSATFNT